MYDFPRLILKQIFQHDFGLGVLVGHNYGGDQKNYNGTETAYPGMPFGTIYTCNTGKVIYNTKPAYKETSRIRIFKARSPGTPNTCAVFEAFRVLPELTAGDVEQFQMAVRALRLVTRPVKYVERDNGNPVGKDGRENEERDGELGS